MKAFSISLVIAAAIVHFAIVWLPYIYTHYGDLPDVVRFLTTGIALPIVLLGAAISVWKRR